VHMEEMNWLRRDCEGHPLTLMLSFHLQ
jgi:hypothetical protein